MPHLSQPRQRFRYRHRSAEQWRAAAGLDDPDAIGVAGAAWLQEILDATAMSERVTDWEEQFLADLGEKFERFGPRLYVSERQLEVLERIEGRLRQHGLL